MFFLDKKVNNGYLHSVVFLLLIGLMLLVGINIDSAMARDAKGRFVVVLDPGHGGKDSGAVGRNAKEKDVVLDVAKKVATKLEALNPDIVVHFTRRTDKFIGLAERTQFANKKKADLFVSIHANSHKTRTPNGAETYVLGLHRTQDNLEVAMKENSAILYEDDSEVKYENFDPTSTESYIIFEFMQNRHLDASIELAELVQRGMVSGGLGDRGVKQAGFLVLRTAAMPSILVELGFISNAKDEAYMTSKKGSNQLANNIANAIVRYEQRISARSGAPSGTVAKDVAPSTPSTSTEVAKDRSDGTIYYRVQVHADRRELPANAAVFKGYENEVRCYKEGRLYKYTLFNVTDLSTAKQLQRELKQKHKQFKDCFIVGFNSTDEKVSTHY